MSRVKRLIEDVSEIEAILRKGRVCRLAMLDGEFPYVVPVIYGYADGRLIVHSRPSGRKLELMRANPNVAFEVDVDVELLVGKDICSWAMRYRSVVGRGRAVIVDDARKVELLKVLVGHCTGHAPADFPGGVENLVVIEILIEEMTGKELRK